MLRSMYLARVICVLDKGLDNGETHNERQKVELAPRIWTGTHANFEALRNLLPLISLPLMFSFDSLLVDRQKS